MDDSRRARHHLPGPVDCWEPPVSDVHDGHTPGDGYGPDVDPDSGDEAETEEVPSSTAPTVTNATATSTVPAATGSDST